MQTQFSSSEPNPLYHACHEFLSDLRYAFSEHELKDLLSNRGIYVTSLMNIAQEKDLQEEGLINRANPISKPETDRTIGKTNYVFASSFEN